MLQQKVSNEIAAFSLTRDLEVVNCSFHVPALACTTKIAHFSLSRVHSCHYYGTRCTVFVCVCVCFIFVAGRKHALDFFRARNNVSVDNVALIVRYLTDHRQRHIDI